MNKKIIRLTESDLHRIIREVARKVIMENEYKSPSSKVLAASHIASRKEGGKSGSERYRDWIAKQAAISDINKELRGKRVNPTHKSYANIWSNENGGRVPDLKRSRQFQDYMDSNDEFYNPISNDTFDDSDKWLNNRDFLDNLDYE
jgi:hypothetical protein